MVIIYEFRRTINKPGLSFGCARRFKMAKGLKKPQPTKTTTTERWLLKRKHCQIPERNCCRRTKTTQTTKYKQQNTHKSERKQQKYNKEITKSHKTKAASAEEELKRSRMADNMSARKTHAPASKIYSRARVGHAPSRAGRMEAGSVAVESGETEEHSGMARLRVGIPEIYRSEFGKPKSKNFEKMTDLPKWTERGSRFRRMVGEGEADSDGWLVKEKPMYLLLKDKTAKEVDMASKKAGKAFKEAGESSKKTRKAFKEAKVSSKKTRKAFKEAKGSSSEEGMGRTPSSSSTERQGGVGIRREKREFSQKAV